jgi:hypothetical protein
MIAESRGGDVMVGWAVNLFYLGLPGSSQIGLLPRRQANFASALD